MLGPMCLTVKLASVWNNPSCSRHARYTHHTRATHTQHACLQRTRSMCTAYSITCRHTCHQTSPRPFVNLFSRQRRAKCPQRRPHLSATHCMPQSPSHTRAYVYALVTCNQYTRTEGNLPPTALSPCLPPFPSCSYDRTSSPSPWMGHNLAVRGWLGFTRR